MESGWNTQFDTNCGRLPAAFRYFVSKNPLMRDYMDKEQKNPDVLLCVHRDFP